MTSIKHALWRNNPAMVQMIGLCPLLAVSSSVAVALLLAFCTLAVLVVAMSLIALFRHAIATEIRLPIFVLLIAGCTTLVEIGLQLVVYEFYLIIGLFVPLITTNCLLLARAESYASKHSFFASTQDAFLMGLGFAWVLVALGAMREVFGQGTLFVGLAELLPFWSDTWVLQLDAFTGFPLFALPPGGFIMFALLLVVRNFIKQNTHKSVDYEPTKTRVLS